MDTPTRSAPPSWLAALRPFAGGRLATEQCEVCSAALAAEHAHLVEPASRRLLCACPACAILFSSPHSTRYRRVPRRIQFLPEFRLTDAQWESMLIPISMAFFYRSTAAGRVVGYYPSPAGATESLLALEAWEALAAENPLLADLEPDVEALLVNRVGSAREHFRVPIDECYRLVGLVRTHWRGLSGGPTVWGEIEGYFRRLRELSSPLGERSHA